MSKVAVVILNWNGSDLLQKFLPPLIEHTDTNLARLIVVDNGSTDNSIQTLQQFEEIEIFRLPKNYGFALGYNKALELIYSQYFVLLNSDVQVTAGWLEPMLHFLESNPEYATCQPKIRSLNEPKMFEYAGAAGGHLDKFGYPFCRGRILQHIEPDTQQYDKVSSEIFWASGACLMTRAHTYTQLGGLDHQFWAHMEEIDYCWRSQNQGLKVAIVPQSSVYHLGGGSLEYGSPRKLYLNYRNNLFMLYKNLPSEQLFSTIFQRMILDGVSAFVLLFQGQWHGLPTVLKAHLHFYLALPSLRKKRKETPAQHKKGYGNLSKKSILWAYYVKKIRTFSAFMQYKN